MEVVFSGREDVEAKLIRSDCDALNLVIHLLDAFAISPNRPQRLSFFDGGWDSRQQKNIELHFRPPLIGALLLTGNARQCGRQAVTDKTVRNAALPGASCGR